MTKRRMTFAAVLCCTLLLSLSNCLLVDSEPEANYNPALSETIEHRYQLDRLNLRSMENGDPNRPPIVFIHGTPGSWEFFESYLNAPELQDKARLIAIDRQGGENRGLSGTRKQPCENNPICLGIGFANLLTTHQITNY